MSFFTPNYGALNEIIDDTKIYSMKDSTGTEFTFEVYPVKISKEEINEVLGQTKDIWFISFEKQIQGPTDNEIKKVLEQGLIIKLSMNVILIDNFGFIHRIEFDKTNEKYKIVLTKNSHMIQYLEHLQLSDSLIDIIKQSSSPKLLVQGLSIHSRIMFTNVFNKIKDLEEKLKILEQK